MTKYYLWGGKTRQELRLLGFSDRNIVESLTVVKEDNTWELITFLVVFSLILGLFLSILLNNLIK